MTKRQIIKIYYQVHYFIDRQGYWITLEENGLNILLELRDIESITVKKVIEEPVSIFCTKESIERFVDKVKSHRPLFDYIEYGG